MELLDGEEKKFNPSGKILGFIGGIFYIIGSLACLYGIQGCWLLYSLWFHLGTKPSEIESKPFVEMAMHAQLVATFPLIIGFICQRIAFSKYNYSPLWIWQLLLVSSVISILASFIPISPIIFILAIINLIHLYKKKKNYFEFEA